MKSYNSYLNIKWLPILLLSVVFAIMHALSYYPLVSLPINQLLLRSLIDAVILMSISLLLIIIIPSLNYVRLDINQQIINYTALGILIVALWVALSFGASYLIFGSNSKSEIINMLPMTALIGALLYVSGIQYINRRVGVEINKEQNDTDETDAIEDNDASEDEQSEIEAIERIAIKTGQKIHVIMINEIIYIEADGDYVKIVTDNGRYIKESTMKFFESGLPASQFVRVHRSYIVNIEKILQIELYEKQTQVLKLSNGDQLRSSVSGYKALKDALNL